MGLFGFNTKEEEAAPSFKKVRPVALQTENVAKELLRVSDSYGIKVNNLDFTLLEVQTFVRTNSSKGEADYEEVGYEYFDDLDLEKTFLNPNFQIKQVYEVEIFSKKTKHTILLKIFIWR